MKLKIGNDTIIGLTIDQLKTVNKKFAYSNYLEEQNLLLKNRTAKMITLSLTKDSLLNEKSVIINELNTINKSTIDDINSANNKILTLTKERDKYKKRIKTFSYISLSTIFVAIAAIL